VRQAVNRGANWIVEVDIEAYYDRIDHDLLMRLVEKRVCDRRMLKLLWQWLKAGVLDAGELLPSDQGVPQGGVISCVLANVVLHELDRVWEDRCSQVGQLIRYADDGVVLCRTEAQAREALWRLGVILSRLKLTLHPTKTQMVYVGDGRQGFDFLGFHCRKVDPGSTQAIATRSAGRADERCSACGSASRRSPHRGTTCPNRSSHRGRSQPSAAPLGRLLSGRKLSAQIPRRG
jgi:group II intron reverse transcriptase/maturase